MAEALLLFWSGSWAVALRCSPGAWVNDYHDWWLY